MSASPGGGSRAATLIGWTGLVLLWLVAGVAICATGVEVFLRARLHWQMRQEAAHDLTPNKHRLERAYDKSVEMHVNPQYVFFLPDDPQARTAMSNEVCAIDADGFRGPGPAHAGGRPLAFLLGGSAAFGYYASSDATTITGYLNTLQDKYFFVNAGISSWNSTQEMFRLAFQIMDYHPALIVAYDGANDADRTAFDYAAGLPDGFETLTALVGETESPPKRAAVALAGYLFPQLKIFVESERGPTEAEEHARADAVPERIMRAGVDRYLSNLSRMHDLATGRGARFVAIFQPIAQLHRHLSPAAAFEHFKPAERFHRAVTEQIPRDLEFHDLGDIFDQYYAAIPVPNPDITNTTVFVDQFHLYDPGNEIIARELVKVIR